MGIAGALAPQLPRASDDFLAVIYPCRKPITYTTGAIDPRFKLSVDQLKRAAQGGEQIWERSSGKNLFEFSQSEGITINLAFDQRQQLTQQAEGVEGGIEQGKQSYDALVLRHDRLVKQFQNRLADYNQTVARYNGQGGAPKEEYEKLREENRQLNAMIDEINALVRQLNQLAKKLNLRVGEFNKITGEFNETLTVKPEAGLYSPLESSITIYQYDSMTELTRTIAHELGHAIGVGHVDEADALMAPQVSDGTHVSPADLTALTAVCETPRPFTASQKIALWLKLLYERFR